MSEKLVLFKATIAATITIRETENPKDHISFNLGDVHIGSVYLDDRVAPPWIVEWNGAHHSCCKPSLRFNSKEEGIKFVLGELDLKIEDVKRESHE